MQLTNTCLAPLSETEMTFRVSSVDNAADKAAHLLNLLGEDLLCKATAHHAHHPAVLNFAHYTNESLEALGLAWEFSALC